jgi:hypothetical protein
LVAVPTTSSLVHRIVLEDGVEHIGRVDLRAVELLVNAISEGKNKIKSYLRYP